MGDDWKQFLLRAANVVLSSLLIGITTMLPLVSGEGLEKALADGAPLGPLLIRPGIAGAIAAGGALLQHLRGSPFAPPPAGTLQPLTPGS